MDRMECNMLLIAHPVLIRHEGGELFKLFMAADPRRFHLSYRGKCAGITPTASFHSLLYVLNRQVYILAQFRVQPCGRLKTRNT